MMLSAGSMRTRLARFCVTGFVFVLVLTLLLGPAAGIARAEEGESKGDSSADNMFVHLMVSVGPFFGLVLGTVSVALMALVVLLLMDLRMGVAVPQHFVDDFTDLVNRRKFKEAYDMAKNDSSFLGRVMAAGMDRLKYSLEDAREAAYGTVETIKSSKEQLNAYLSTIGTLGPLLGLVGTVWGMIGAFRVIAASNKIDPKALAAEISHALVVTLFGVFLSVPAIFAHTFFRNRVTSLAMHTGTVADDLLTQMYHNSKKPAPAGAPAAAAPVPLDVDARAGSPAIKQK